MSAVLCARIYDLGAARAPSGACRRALTGGRPVGLNPGAARGRAPGGVRGEGPQALREGRALARAAAGFRRGRLAAVYLPPAYPLDGFEYAIAPLIGGGPEEAYARLAELLGELASWARYARWRWREAAERCAGSDGAAPALLSVGRESLLGLAEMVAHPARIGVGSPAAALCAGAPEGWREMGTTADDLFVRATVYTLYDLIAALERRP